MTHKDERVVVDVAPVLDAGLQGRETASARGPSATSSTLRESRLTSTRQYQSKFSRIGCWKKNIELKRHMWRYDSLPPYCEREERE